MKRNLSLKRENLAELTSGDLLVVVGGQQALSDRYGNCTLDNSWRVCSLQCHLTFNTCD